MNTSYLILELLLGDGEVEIEEEAIDIGCTHTNKMMKIYGEAYK